MITLENIEKEKFSNIITLEFKISPSFIVFYNVDIPSLFYLNDSATFQNPEFSYEGNGTLKMKCEYFKDL